MRDSFYEISKALTGETELDPQRAAALQKRIETYYPDELDELLHAFEKESASGNMEQAVKAALGENEDAKERLHLLAREIIKVWYLGEFQTPSEDVDPVGSVEHFSEGLLWKVIRAHAPAFTNAGYGAWADHPDNVGKYPINQSPTNQAMRPKS
jgi:hypothetical protein